jgi:nucleoside-diphosphate-sugar epimerase
MKIAITGATGVLGQNLVPLLIKHRYEVLALVRSISKAKSVLPSSVEKIEYDLLNDSDTEYLSSSLEGCQCVVHIATSIPIDFNKPGAWDTNNKLRTIGTKKLIEASLNAGIKRYIQQSIVMAYSDGGDEWINEEHPLDESPDREVICTPVIEMENLVKAIPDNKMDWFILRAGIFVGNDTFQEKTLRDLKDGLNIVTGNGNNYVSFIHVADMAGAILRSIENETGNLILNIVTKPVKQIEYLKNLAEKIGAMIPVQNHKLPTPPSFRCSNLRAQYAINWKPDHNIYPF